MACAGALMPIRVVLYIPSGKIDRILRARRSLPGRYPICGSSVFVANGAGVIWFGVRGRIRRRRTNVTAIFRPSPADTRGFPVENYPRSAPSSKFSLRLRGPRSASTWRGRGTCCGIPIKIKNSSSELELHPPHKNSHHIFVFLTETSIPWV